MIPRHLCGLLVVALAAPCLAQDPPKPNGPSTQMLLQQYSPSRLTPSPPPVVGIPKGSAYVNRGSKTGNYWTCCGPGTQYMAPDCPLRLDLSYGVGLWDPCNCMGPHPSCW